MPNLPIELYRPIVAAIDSTNDRETIYSLLLVSRILHFEAERQLYRSVKGRCDSPSLRFLGTVIGNARLARMVLSYEFLGVTSLGRAGLKLLQLGLRALVNLKLLRIEGDHLIEVAWLLRGCKFHLEDFDCWHHTPDGVELSAFLNHQSSIKQLKIKWDARDRLPTFVCPNLSVLNGNRGAIEAFLPGRQITRLFWNAATVGETKLPLSFEVCNSLRSLRIMTLAGATSDSCPPFNTFFEYLHSLEVLDLHDDRIIDPCVVAQIPKLKALVLSGMFTSSPRISPNEKRLFVKKLFEECKYLQSVDFRSHKYYERWEAKSIGPRRVSYAQANWWYYS